MKLKPLAELVKEFWPFCQNRHVSLQAECLLGLTNAVADWNSRRLKDYSHWRQHPQVFKQIQALWGPLKVDIFASRLNTQLPTFFSWRPDLEAAALHASLKDWGHLQGYAPPSPLA